MRPRTLPALTGLRFPLALAVLLFHYASGPAKTAYFPFAGMVSSGFAAVSGFFVLSGFILSHTYAADSGALRGSRWAFWSARFARVYPIYLLSLVLIYQAYLMTEARGLWSIVIATVSSLTLTQAWIPSAALSINSAGWSLSVEAFLYLCFPSLLFLVGTGTKRLIALLGLCCGVSLAPALLFVAAQHGGDALTSLVRYNPVFHLASFVTGMAMERLTRYRQLPAWSGWLSLAAIGTAFAAGRGIPYEILNNGLLALPFAVLIGRLAGSMNPLSNLLGSRPLVQLGDASYSLYILHLPLEPAVLAINAQTLHFNQASWGFVAEALVFCVAVSLLVFRTIEDPYRRRIREYLRKLPISRGADPLVRAGPPGPAAASINKYQ